MTRKIQVHQVDAFTRERFTGNPAGVVLNADGLSETQMLAIARELNNADPAFILAPDNSEHGMRARFFTPRTEVGFVGHATVAGALAAGDHLALGKDTPPFPAPGGNGDKSQRSICPAAPGAARQEIIKHAAMCGNAFPPFRSWQGRS